MPLEDIANSLVTVTDTDRLQADGTGTLTMTAVSLPPESDLPPRHPSPQMPVEADRRV
jgi:hypothetical protein